LPDTAPTTTVGGHIERCGSSRRTLIIRSRTLSDGGSGADRSSEDYSTSTNARPETHGISVVSYELVVLGLVISESHVGHRGYRQDEAEGQRGSRRH
jgi:hypothetical protein